MPIEPSHKQCWVVQLKWKQANYDKDCVYQQPQRYLSWDCKSVSEWYHKELHLFQDRLIDKIHFKIHLSVPLCLSVCLYVNKRTASSSMHLKSLRLLLVKHIWSDIFQFKTSTQSLKDKLRRIFTWNNLSFFLSSAQLVFESSYMQHLLAALLPYSFFTLFIRSSKIILECHLYF